MFETNIRIYAGTHAYRILLLVLPLVTDTLDKFTVMQLPNGLWPRVRDDVSRIRSRWDTVPAIMIGYQELAESSRRLTLAVALLASGGFVVALLCTGLSMLNHFYGLHVIGLGIAWPAATSAQKTSEESAGNFGSYGNVFRSFLTNLFSK